MAATIRASTEGLKIVDAARRKKGWAKAKQAWASLALTSVPTLRRFWAGVAIQKETFQKICETVGITDWESIADFETINEWTERSYSKRLIVKLEATFEGTDKQTLDDIIKYLQKLTGDPTIKILDIEEGSIKLILGASPEALEEIEALFRSGDLNEISEILVQDIHFLDKEELVLLINKNGGAAQNLVGSDLSGSDLSGSDLNEANLIRANLSEANLNGAYLIRADLRGSDLSEANLSEANLIRANLSEANLNGADLRGAYLIRADLRAAYLRGAYLIRADLSVAYLRGVYLNGAYLSGVNLTGVDLIRADLRGSDLREADLRGSDLSGANLSGANLSGANLSGANLIRADLIRADLIRANLSGANLSGADLIEARFANNLGLTKSDKFNMQERGAIFEDAPESDVPSLVNR